MIETGTPSAVSGRLVSLDLFRGATIAAMILDNNPGDWVTVYWPLLPAPWHGSKASPRRGPCRSSSA